MDEDSIQEQVNELADGSGVYAVLRALEEYCEGQANRACEQDNRLKARDWWHKADLIWKAKSEL